MKMTIDEIIKTENEIAAEHQKVVDTHIVDDNGFTVEEMYCDDSEAIDDHLSRCKILADYHKQIADVMCKYQKIKEQVDIAIDKENFTISDARLIQIKEIIDENVDW